MSRKQVYIGISIIAILMVSMIAGIFYIIFSNKDVKYADFTKNITEDTKEAMKLNEEENEEKEEQKAEDEVVENEEKLSNEEVSANEKQEVQERTDEKKEEKAKNKTKVPEVTKKEFTVSDMSKSLYVKASSLNIRSGPDTTYSKIGALKSAEEVTITGKVDGIKWYRISHNNKVGYVDGTYLSETKPIIEEKPVNNENLSVTSISSPVNSLIIINSRNNTLRYYVNGSLSRSYSCATGKGSTPTPTGKFSVYNKIVNRPYYKDNIPGGAPNNPLGKRWIGLDCYGTAGTTYAIHGTNNEGSIGKNVSHGCIRMHNADVEAFYEIVPVGTTVIIQNSNKSDKEIAAGYNISIE